jgi:high-affinity iron transporter
MFQSFVIMLREGIEAALIVAILLLAVRKSGKHSLERPIYLGLALAVLASIAAAVVLHELPLSEELWEGSLYWASAAFVISMMAWMHRNAKGLRRRVEGRVQRSGVRAREAWALGGFAFLMVFREGAEAVLFLAAVNLTTQGMLGFIGSLAGLVAAVAFGVAFVRGSLHVDLRRFFAVTEWVLGIFVAQLVINGYHEFSEAGLLPATPRTMALVGPAVRHNSLFILALVAIPLFAWLTRPAPAVSAAPDASQAERRLALARSQRERRARLTAVAAVLAVLVVVGVVYAREIVPKTLPPTEVLMADAGSVEVPVARLADGKLHHFGLLTHGRMVRFLAIETADGTVHTALDACEICGSFGYVQEGKYLVCLNCEAEINPATLGIGGGCNPIPLPGRTRDGSLRVAVNDLQSNAFRFAPRSGPTGVDPVCGMRVKLNEAAGFETYHGKTYYFCRPQCQKAFHANPAAYVGTAPPR